MNFQIIDNNELDNFNNDYNIKYLKEKYKNNNLSKVNNNLSKENNNLSKENNNLKETIKIITI